MIFMLALLSLAAASMFLGVIFGMAYGIEQERERLRATNSRTGRRE